MSKKELLRILETLVIYFSTVRRAGHSKLMKTLFDATPEAICLADSQNTIRTLGLSPKQAFTMDQVHYRLRGLRRPLFIDNFALHRIFAESIKAIRSHMWCMGEPEDDSKADELILAVTHNRRHLVGRKRKVLGKNVLLHDGSHVITPWDNIQHWIYLGEVLCTIIGRPEPFKSDFMMQFMQEPVEQDPWAKPSGRYRFVVYEVTTNTLQDEFTSESEARICVTYLKDKQHWGRNLEGLKYGIREWSGNVWVEVPV